MKRPGEITAPSYNEPTFACFVCLDTGFILQERDYGYHKAFANASAESRERHPATPARRCGEA